MIIKNICLLFEMLSITMCLHQLYNEKYRLDIETVSLLVIDMIMMQIIDYTGLSNKFSLLIYPIIIIYCGVKFGFKLKIMVTNIILCIIIVGGFQMLSALIIYFFRGIHIFSNISLLLLNCIVFILILAILPLLKINRLVEFLRESGKIVILVIGVCLTWVSFWMLSYKNIKYVELKEAIMLFVSMILILILAGQLNKYKLKAKEMEIELKMYELYSEPFQELIDNMRVRQHEFDNHINAIYSLQYSCNTFKELIDAQGIYCEKITKENRFNKLLSCDNSVIRGFLYTKFVKIDRMGIEVDYKVILNEHDVGIPIYKIIEILGNLINNAVEALEVDNERNKLYVSIIETDCLQLEVRNESPYISYNRIVTFFEKNYSDKGKNRGLGLYNVKQICNKYGMEFFCENIEVDRRNWFSFRIKKKIAIKNS